MKRALYWFTSDLRLQDNFALSATLMGCHSIAFVYVLNPAWFEQRNYHQAVLGQRRFAFLLEALHDLHQQLQQQGHELQILLGEPAQQISDYVRQQDIQLLACGEPVGWQERQVWQYLQEALPHVQCVSRWNNTLFEAEQLVLNKTALASFSRFRKQVESAAIAPIPVCQIWLETLPMPLAVSEVKVSLADIRTRYAKVLPPAMSSIAMPTPSSAVFIGGEAAARHQLEQYFSSSAPSHYKETRNALDGWNNSTKLSPYLALGCLSARQVWQRLKRYETEQQANDSTYWIGFELLWREYFQWLALELGPSLFQFQGLATKRPLTSFYSERFNKWCQGNTPYPLVNACMRQLNATGFMSNRGRQIVASCLVNELALDWRYGAAYFQQQLLDHDVAANWGNWQYIAGVGVDPRGGRHFNIEKQTALYDPNGDFIAKWQGELGVSPLDSVDAADWPVGFPE